MASIGVSDRIIIVRLSFNDCSVACDRFRGHRNQVYPQAENNGSLAHYSIRQVCRSQIIPEVMAVDPGSESADQLPGLPVTITYIY